MTIQILIICQRNKKTHRKKAKQIEEVVKDSSKEKDNWRSRLISWEWNKNIKETTHDK